MSDEHEGGRPMRDLSTTLLAGPPSAPPESLQDAISQLSVCRQTIARLYALDPDRVDILNALNQVSNAIMQLQQAGQQPPRAFGP
jgi:hypothetical protein